MKKIHSLVYLGFILILCACTANVAQPDSTTDATPNQQAPVTKAAPATLVSPLPEIQQTSTPMNFTGGEISITELPVLPSTEIAQQTLPSSRPPDPAVQSAADQKPTLSPDEWKDLPIVPQVSPAVKEIYQRGLDLGKNPQAFSKIGDCGSTPSWFLGDFDRGARYYNLGKYQYLEPVIQGFQGSYSRTSLAAKSGFNVSSIFSPLWSNAEQCESGETPVACEYRIHRPAIALITLGANDVYHPEEFEPQMRKLIQYSIEQGVIPVLATKADNVEGDGSINATIARLALEYDIPLWNYWRAIQDLPDQGLQPDQVHITWGPNRFDDPQNLTRGWPVRNLTALQTLDAIWQVVSHTINH